ncbi:endolytic transglycosylase MltG [Streptomyces sp. NPDC005955]|uniref:endolytic transglycosylase MltG n=1 Tax=Streptomyces sp. NPDC005955 TaxID=3364738 RepID=UPI0036AC8B24
MTDYGRGQGSEPWYPEDPLYGDVGWEGQQQGHPGQSPQTGHQQYPQGEQYGHQGQPGHFPQHQQQHQHQQEYVQQQVPQGYDQQVSPGYDQQVPQGYDQWAAQTAPAQSDGYGQQYQGGWETAQPGQIPYGTDPTGTYPGQPEAYGVEPPDYYGTPEAYPPPEPPARRRPEPEPEEEPARGDGRQDWDPDRDGPEEGFFADSGRGAPAAPRGPDADGYDDEYDDEPSGRDGDRRSRGGKGKQKRRNGCACLLVTAVFVGGLGAVSYFGYQFYQDRFGEPADFAGDGLTTTVSVEIPKDSGGYVIGQKLKEAGVIKSVDAFVSAQQQHPKGNTVQDGVYTLRKEMSAASALELMLSPKSRNNLIIAEGRRNIWVYEQIDKRLDLPGGTTKGVASAQWKSLGLPDWAMNGAGDRKDPLEGFLYPSSYPVAEGMKPADVLKKMVTRAKNQYETYDLQAKAREVGLKNPLEVITVASLVQAEGMTHDDFKKMAAVVYNRLKPDNTATNRKIEFDSSYNYLKNQSKIDISTREIRNYDHPYNTYFVEGLPPGPIGNPGEDALRAAIEPDGGDWMFFVSIDGKTTKFTETLAEHEELVAEFNERRKNGE